MQAFDLLNREIFSVKTGKIRPHCGEVGGAAADAGLLGEDI